MPLNLVTDRDPHPMRPLAKPEPGETYTDPAFGTRITRITAAHESMGDDAVIKPCYSTPPAWNADESRLLLWQRGVGHVLYEGEPPYRRLGVLPLEAPSDESAVWWDPDSPDTLYYPSEYRSTDVASGVRLMMCRIEVGGPADKVLATSTTLHDFAERPLFLPRDGYTISAGGDPQWMSRKGKHVGLRIGKEAIVYSIAERELWLSLPFTNVGIYKNAFIPSPSGLYYLFDRWVYDADTMELVATLGMANPYEHACAGLMTEGLIQAVDVWNTIDFDHPTLHGTLVTYTMDSGRARVIVGPRTGYPYPPGGTHISSTGPADFVAVGIVGTGQGQTVLDNEILLANLATGQVARVAHARTFAGEGRWGYWSETHVSISPKGTRIVFASDWGNGPTVDSYDRSSGGCLNDGRPTAINWADRPLRGVWDTGRGVSGRRVSRGDRYRSGTGGCGPRPCVCPESHRDLLQRWHTTR